MELIRAINNGEFPRPRAYRELPESLEAIILRAMHREPAQRFPSVRNLGRALWPFAGAAHQEIWRAEYGPDAEPLPAQPPAPSATAFARTATQDGRADVTREGAGTNAWWHRFLRRRR